MSLVARAWLVILVGGVVTYGIRSSFLLLAHRFGDIPPAVRDALRMIPAAALAALVLPALLRPEGEIAVLNPRALAGAIALAVAWRTRNVLATILVGLAVVIPLDRLLGGT